MVAIEKGIISIAEALERRDLSEEELAIWTHDYAALGEAGLRLKNRPLARNRRGGPRAADRVVSDCGH